MPLYVYGCKNDHREEIVHNYEDDPLITCPECEQEMLRVPQVPTVAHSPLDTLYEWSDHNYKLWRAGKPRFSPNAINRPTGGLPKDQRSK